MVVSVAGCYTNKRHCHLRKLFSGSGKHLAKGQPLKSIWQTTPIVTQATEGGEGLAQPLAVLFWHRKLNLISIISRIYQDFAASRELSN